MSSIQMSSTSRLRREGTLGTTTGTTISLRINPSAEFTGTPLRIAFLNNVCIIDTRDAAGTLEIRDNGSTVFPTISVPNVLTIGIPVYITVIINGTIAKLFINGIDSSSSVVTTYASDTGFHIGETADALPGQYGDIRVYDRGLTGAQIDGIATARGSDGDFRGLLMRLICNEVTNGATISNGTIKNIVDPSFDMLSQGTTPPVGGNGSLGVYTRKRRR